MSDLYQTVSVGASAPFFLSGLYGLEVERLDRERAIWSFKVTKTRGRTFYREIAVPRQLVQFMEQYGDDVKMPSESTVKRHMAKLSDEIGVKLLPKIFRKDWACRAEESGASPDLINLHQGRAQTGVLYQHYITNPNRAVRLCRPFIQKMFGESEGDSQD